VARLQLADSLLRERVAFDLGQPVGQHAAGRPWQVRSDKRRNPFQPARGMSPSYAAVIARLKVA
jgi:hypothetical protein